MLAVARLDPTFWKGVNREAPHCKRPWEVGVYIDKVQIKR